MPSAGSLLKHIKPVAKNLSVWFDSNLSFEQNTTKLVQTCFYHLRNISRIRSILSLKDAEAILHTLISSRLNYYISFFTCLNQKSINRLQTVRNSAARLLARSKRSNHITLVLASLHWLLVCFRILLLTFKALQSLSPCYISGLLVAYKPAHSLRSFIGS